MLVMLFAMVMINMKSSIGITGSQLTCRKKSVLGITGSLSSDAQSVSALVTTDQLVRR